MDVDKSSAQYHKAIKSDQLNINNPDSSQKDFTQHLSDDVTLITAYFNIGEFPKGNLNPERRRGPANYSNWMASFGKIRNPVVAFFDHNDTLRGRFEQLRKSIDSKTDIRGIEREKLWTFRILNNISKIFSQRDYPRHYPNTVIPHYACVSSSRFELVKMVIDENPFRTRYFAWVDIGYFRGSIAGNQTIRLQLPHGFNNSRTSFTEVIPRNETLTADEIVRRNINWVAAGYFTGRIDVMYKFVTGYLANLEYFLSRGLMAADQQMIYSMMNTAHTRSRLTDIQTYGSRLDNSVDCQRWFFLGCICWKKPITTSGKQ